MKAEAFDPLMPFSERRSLLSLQEAGKCFGRTRSFAETLVREGKLEAHAVKDRQVARKRVTRRSVLLCLVEQATYNPAFFMERQQRLLDAMTVEQLSEVITYASKRRDARA